MGTNVAAERIFERAMDLTSQGSASILFSRMLADNEPELESVAIPVPIESPATVLHRAKLIADIIVGVFGDDTEDLLFGGDADFSKLWDESKYRRHPKGARFGGRFAPKNSEEAVTAVHGAIQEALSGVRTEESASELVDLLSNLTLNQLRDIKLKYQISASGRLKIDLVAKIAERLDSGRRTPVVTPAPRSPGIKLSAEDRYYLEPSLRLLESTHPPGSESRVHFELQILAYRNLMDGKPLSQEQYDIVVSDLQRVYNTANSAAGLGDSFGTHKSRTAKSVLESLGVDAEQVFKEQVPDRRGPIDPVKQPAYDPDYNGRGRVSREQAEQRKQDRKAEALNHRFTSITTGNDNTSMIQQVLSAPNLTGREIDLLVDIVPGTEYQNLADYIAVVRPDLESSARDTIAKRNSEAQALQRQIEVQNNPPEPPKPMRSAIDRAARARAEVAASRAAESVSPEPAAPDAFGNYTDEQIERRKLLDRAERAMSMNTDLINRERYERLLAEHGPLAAPKNWDKPQAVMTRNVSAEIFSRMLISGLGLKSAGWDESRVVRHGKGDERGGEFAPKNGGDSFNATTPGATVQAGGYGGMREGFSITTDSGARATGYMFDADFGKEKSSKTRGELFYIEVPESQRGQGVATSLATDAIALMQSQGAQTVSMHPMQPGAKELNARLRENGIIYGPINTLENGKEEYGITQKGDVDGRSKGAASFDFDNPYADVRWNVLDWAEHKFGETEKARAFTEWFSDSKIVGENGLPLIVYHGTDADITEFDPGKVKESRSTNEYGIYTTPNKRYGSGYGKNLIPLYVAMKNPKIVADKSEISPRDLTREDIQKLQSQGYDGIVSTSRNGTVSDIWNADEIVVFESNQLKHASKNSGDFGPESGNIFKALSQPSALMVKETGSATLPTGVKDGDGDGYIFDGLPNQQAAPIKQEAEKPVAPAPAAENSTPEPKVSLRRVAKVMEDAKAIKWTDETHKVDSSSDGDYGSLNDTFDDENTLTWIRDNDTSAEWRLDNYLTKVATSAAEEAWDDEDPEINLEQSDIDTQAGYSQREVHRMLRKEFADNEPFIAVLEKWDDDSFDTGEEAFHKIREFLEDAKVPVPEGFNDLEETAIEAIRNTQSEAEITAIDDARETFVDSYISDYDSDRDRTAWLKDYWQDNIKGEIPNSSMDSIPRDTWYNGEYGKTLVFDTDNGWYEINANEGSEMLGAMIHNVTFNDEKGSFDRTGSAGATTALRVMDKVSASMLAYMNNLDEPGIITFSAKSEARQNVYERMVRTVAKIKGDYVAYSIETPQFSQDTKAFAIVPRAMAKDAPDALRSEYGHMAVSQQIVKSLKNERTNAVTVRRLPQPSHIEIATWLSDPSVW